MASVRSVPALLFIAAVLTMASARIWHGDMGWCRSANQERIYQGDFNGDGRTDLLCHRETTGDIMIALARENGEFTGTTWRNDVPFCIGPNEKLYIGDFNGRGVDILLCHNNELNSGMAISGEDGGFNHLPVWIGHIQHCPSSELIIADIDGNRVDDLLCRVGVTIYVTFGGPDFFSSSGMPTPLSLDWCPPGPVEIPFGQTLVIGDSDGDGIVDDFLCRSLGSISFGEYVWFQGLSRTTVMGPWCTDPADELLVGTGVMFCHNTVYGRVTFIVGTEESNFRELPMPFCYEPDSQFLIGDYDGDGSSDLMCHNTRYGSKEIIFAS